MNSVRNTAVVSALARALVLAEAIRLRPAKAAIYIDRYLKATTQALHGVNGHRRPARNRRAHGNSS